MGQRKLAGRAVEGAILKCIGSLYLAKRCCDSHHDDTIFATTHHKKLVVLLIMRSGIRRCLYVNLGDWYVIASEV